MEIVGKLQSIDLQGPTNKGILSTLAILICDIPYSTPYSVHQLTFVTLVHCISQVRSGAQPRTSRTAGLGRIPPAWTRLYHAPLW